MALGTPLALLICLALAGCANQGPTLLPLEDIQAWAGSELTLELTATDPDGDSLTFSYISPIALTDAHIEAHPPTKARFLWTPASHEVGVHRITFQASDGAARDEREVRVMVAPESPSLRFISPFAYLVEPSQGARALIQVEDPHAGAVTLTLERPIGEGEEALEVQDLTSALYTWTPDQTASRALYAIEVKAADEVGQVVTMTISFILLSDAPPCQGSPPTITLSLPEQESGPGDYAVEAMIISQEAFLAFAVYAVEDKLRYDDPSLYLSLEPWPGSEASWRGFVPHIDVPQGETREVTVMACALDAALEGDNRDCFACSEASGFVVMGFGTARAGYCEPCSRNSDCLEPDALCDAVLGACLADCSEGQPCIAGSVCQDREDRQQCVPLMDCSQVGGGLPCAPCTQNADCGGPSDLCLQNSLMGYLFCGRDCATGTCPQGFTCMDFGGSILQCVPTSGDCQEMDRAALCRPCQDSAECGGLADLCVQLTGEGSFCSQSCGSDDRFCSSGFACVDLGNSISQCLPSNGSCLDGPVRAPRPGDLLINEILASPAPGDDVNGNGLTAPDSLDDQFIEVINISYLPLSLEGLGLSDGARELFAFPGGVVKAGQGLVIFGDGDVSSFQREDGFGQAQLFSATGLGLSEVSQVIELTGPDWGLIDEVCYDRLNPGGCFAPASQVSLTRSTDGDPQAPLIPHDQASGAGERTSSPGMAIDGSPLGRGE